MTLFSTTASHHVGRSGNIPVIVENENPRSPEGHPGGWEPTTIPTAAAVANAVYDAVASE